MCDTKRLCPSVLASVYKDESVCVHVCLCGGARGGPGAFTRSASCRVEWLEGDNNSQVKIQLFAWGLTLWGLSGRSAGGGVGGGSASETEATYKGLVLVFKPLVVNIWKQLRRDRGGSFTRTLLVAVKLHSYCTQWEWITKSGTIEQLVVEEWQVEFIGLLRNNRQLVKHLCAILLNSYRKNMLMIGFIISNNSSFIEFTWNVPNYNVIAQLHTYKQLLLCDVVFLFHYLSTLVNPVQLLVLTSI